MSASSTVTSSPRRDDVSVIYYDAMQQTWLRVVLISLYVVIFVLGVAGNSLVVYIVCGPRRRRWWSTSWRHGAPCNP